MCRKSPKACINNDYSAQFFLFLYPLEIIDICTHDVPLIFLLLENELFIETAI